MLSEIVEGSEIPCTIKIPEKILNDITKLVEQGKYESRSSFIRIGIRNLLIEEGCLHLIPEHELDSYEKSNLKKSHKDFMRDELIDV